MQLSSWRDRRSGGGHLMGRDVSLQYQHQPNSRRDSNAAEFLEGQEVRGWPPHGEGCFPPISALTQLQEGGWWINYVVPLGHHCQIWNQ